MPSEKSTDLTKAQFRGLEEFVESHKNSGLARLALTVLQARRTKQQVRKCIDDLDFEGPIRDILKKPLNANRKLRLLRDWDQNSPKSDEQIKRFFEAFDRASRKFSRRDAVMRRLADLLRWRRGYPIYEVQFAFLTVQEIAEKLSPAILEEEARWEKSEVGKTPGKLSRQIVAACLKDIIVVRKIDGVETRMRLQRGTFHRKNSDWASIKQLRGRTSAEETWWPIYRKPNSKPIVSIRRWQLVPVEHSE